MKDLKAGIIGCGGIANQKHLPGLFTTGQVAMVSFCDIDEARAEASRVKYGENGAKTYAFANYRDMLEHDGLDMVHICTPNNTHAEIAVAALEAGCHVMCEKPMADTAEGARKMVEAAKRTGKKLTIGYQNRFDPKVRYLKAVCDRGDLGRIYFAKAHALRRRAVPTWGVFMDKEAQGGGPLIDIGTHSLDMTLWCMGNYKPRYAVGTTFHELGKKSGCANAWKPWTPEEFTVEDSAFGWVKMEDGALIIIESSWALNVRTDGEAMCTLCGTEAGADMWDGLQLNGDEFGKLFSKKAQLEPGGVAFYAGDDRQPFELEASSWINAILNDKDPVVLPEQALVVTEILEAIYTSAKNDEPFVFSQKAA